MTGVETTGPATATLPRSGVAVAAEVAGDRVDQLTFLAVFAAVGFGYSILLPFDYTQRISFTNWDYLNTRYLFFTVAFALGMAWVLTLQVHAIRRIARDTSTSTGPAAPAGVFAAFVSLLPSLLCCSPVVPTAVSLLGLSAATRLRTTGRIQYFFATRQDWLLLGALALLAASGLWSTRKLARARCLAEGSCPAPAAPSTNKAHDEAGPVELSSTPNLPERQP